MDERPNITTSTSSRRVANIFGRIFQGIGLVFVCLGVYSLVYALLTFNPGYYGESVTFGVVATSIGALLFFLGRMGVSKSSFRNANRNHSEKTLGKGNT